MKTTENKIENLDNAVRRIRDKINDDDCTINEALYYIGNWQKEKDKVVIDSLLNALKAVYEDDKVTGILKATDRVKMKEAIKKAEQ